MLARALPPVVSRLTDATMRVIAGQYRSRPLRSLRGMDIRPTADRLRETLFNVLCAGNPEALAESVWIDLYAGTGAVGIEALSRGAAMVYFVESSRAAADLIAENLRSLGITGGFQIVKAEAAKALRQLEAAAVAADFVFLDPPYRLREEYAKTLGALADSKLLRGRNVVVAEHEKKFDPGEAFGELRRYRKLVQGDAGLSFYRRVLL
jgi:16S rRNA (guanine966-N2)-methyltransferase